MTAINLVILTYILLSSSKTLKIDILSSDIFGEEYSKKQEWALKIILSLLFFITLPVFIYLTIKDKNMKKLITIGILFLLILGVFNGLGNEKKYYNASINLELQLEKKLEERLTIIRNVNVVLHQRLKIAGINDTAYYKNLYIIATARMDAPQLAMKWIHESNPNINFNEVSELYKDLSASVASYQENILNVEKEMQTIVFEYSRLQREFPSNIYLFWRPSSLKYTPIASDTDRITNTTGRENSLDIK